MPLVVAIPRLLRPSFSGRPNWGTNHRPQSLRLFFPTSEFDHQIQRVFQALGTLQKTLENAGGGWGKSPIAAAIVTHEFW